MSRLDKYMYNIDSIKPGDKIPIICDHEGCHRFLLAKVLNPSIMLCYCSAYKSKFDMRNQTWKCYQHRQDAIEKRNNKINRILKYEQSKL